MTLGQDYAARIRRAADTLDRLDVDRRDPARYLEVKDETLHALRELANAVEIDQVFVGRQGLPAGGQPALRRGPRTIVVKGRAVTVETKRRAVARG